MNIEPESQRVNLYYLTLLLFTLLLSAALLTPAFASDLGLSQADCRCCHGTTLADRHHLLVNTSGRECLSCHPLTLNPDTQSYDLTVRRDCLLCHTGSLADRHHLLVDQVTFDCFTCHAVVWDPLALQYVADFNMSCQASSPPTPAGIISGSVTDQSGTGIGWVRIATNNGVYSTLTSATGTYELPTVIPGSYTLTATLDGYTGASQSVTVSDGQTLTTNFTLSPLPIPATVSGLIFDMNQIPVEGASITSSNGIYSALSATNGTYTLSNVTEGSLDLTVNKPGYIEASQTTSISAGQNLTLNFTLANAIEICTDGVDNNNNGLSDCDDPSCFGVGNCQTPATEICNDGLDNDNNGVIDCSDPACIGNGNCDLPIAEICNDNIDNTGDSLIDCDDPLCSSSIYCLSEICNDGADNNGDGLIDCDDSDCTDTSICLPPPVEICGDNIDNDNNNLTDCDDAKCADLDSCAPPVIEESCNNSIDDNSDGYIDCADPQCKERAICLEEICDNAIDDDADGRVDCEDLECSETTACSTYTGGQSLTLTATASHENPRFIAANIADKDLSTRWKVRKNRRQWLMLDLGGTYPIDKVDIYWHDRYADKYVIMVSKNGRHWRTVERITNGDGGLDSISFRSRDAHFVLIKLKHPVTTGYSVYEVEVFRSVDDDDDDDDD